ncbi:50S ribosomal protein L21 [Oricola cellulosilytica]|uniref:Large ribosomal subunit protein bL21 n=1 Tax=Oricola cellulosilytica TaxID=1429082 RepID=A0A4R0P9G5_9HYPH|nr:50S ribosomal protein L21 [Oricola cellulosilytica]TCD13810.1 50S ribosomal protein L21 [Oricola cellulosilytica]
MFAVIKTGGKQYRVAAEDVLKIEKVAGDAGDIIEFNEVLMVGEGADASIGVPFVDGALVTAEVVEQGRARKVIAFKKRRRQNSQRTRGHRQHLTTVRISEILTGGAKPSKKAAAKKDAPKKEAPKKETAKAEAKAAAKPAEKADAKPAAKAEKKAKAEPAAAATLFTAPKGDADKLTEIKGIGPVAEKQLNEQGITTFAQIAKLTKADIAKIDEAMPFSADQISDWQAQAKELVKK